MFGCSWLIAAFTSLLTLPMVSAVISGNRYTGNFKYGADYLDTGGVPMQFRAYFLDEENVRVMLTSYRPGDEPLTADIRYYQAEGPDRYTILWNTAEGLLHRAAFQNRFVAVLRETNPSVSASGWDPDAFMRDVQVNRDGDIQLHLGGEFSVVLNHEPEARTRWYCFTDSGVF